MEDTMKHNHTEGIVRWMQLPSTPQRSFVPVTRVRFVTEPIRREVRWYAFHRRTGHVPDFLRGIEMRSHGRDARLTG